MREEGGRSQNARSLSSIRPPPPLPLACLIPRPPSPPALRLADSYSLIFAEAADAVKFSLQVRGMRVDGTLSWLALCWSRMLVASNHNSGVGGVCISERGHVERNKEYRYGHGYPSSPVLRNVMF